MRSKIQLKSVIFRVASLPAFKNAIVIIGVLVALLVGFFTLHAQAPLAQQLLVVPAVVNSKDNGAVDTESTSEVMIYNQKLELILSADLSAISSNEQQHLDRLLKICDLMASIGSTVIYQLDK